MGGRSPSCAPRSLPTRARSVSSRPWAGPTASWATSPRPRDGSPGRPTARGSSRDPVTRGLWGVGTSGARPPAGIEIAGFLPGWPAVSVSQDRLAFERYLGRQEIYRFEAGRPPEVVAASSFGGSNPHFSPDGRRFAFESFPSGGGGGRWVAAAPRSRPRG